MNGTMDAIYFTGDYKTKLNEMIDEMFAQSPHTTRTERMSAIERITDQYVEQTGERPDVRALDRMSTLILREELTDTHPDKMTREEYPIMSGTQRRERLKKEIQTDFSDEDDNTNGSHARINAYLASDGKSYRKPIRRTRDIGELIKMEYKKGKR